MRCMLVKLTALIVVQTVLHGIASATPTVHTVTFSPTTVNATITPTASPLPISHFGPNENLAVEFSLLVTGTISASKSFVVRVSPPTTAPSQGPTILPSSRPTRSPSSSPTTLPTVSPTISPTTSPTISPTSSPTFVTNEPTTFGPTSGPTSPTSPTKQTKSPTAGPPTKVPTNFPTRTPTLSPITKPPTLAPTKIPTRFPTNAPTNAPTFAPTKRTTTPTLQPTFGDMTVILAEVTEQAPLSKTQVINSQGQAVDISPNLAITGDTEFIATVILDNPKLDEFPLNRLIIFAWCLKLDNRQQDCQEQPIKYFTVKITVILSSIIANPIAFSYDLDDGVLYSKGTLTPEPIVKLFNVLNSNLEFTVSKTCRESLLRSNQPWLELGITEGEIGAQSGAPKEIDFSINLTASNIRTNVSDPFLENPAALLQGCLEIGGILGSQVLDTTVLIDLSVSRICPSGAFSADRGRDGRQGCQRCPIGTYQSEAGQVSCRSCSEVSSFTTTLDSASRSASNCVALEGYFYNSLTGTVDICPLEAECKDPALTLETLPLKPGMWRTAARSNVMRLCPRVTRKYCIGGVNETAKSLGELGLINEDVVFNATGAYCAKNHAGAYCVACIENSAKRSGPNGLCEPCTSDSVIADQLAFVGGIFALFVALILCFFAIAFLMSLDEEQTKKYFSGSCCGRNRNSQVQNGHAETALNFQSLDFANTVIRILLGHIQVVFIMGKTFENQLPEFLTSYYFSFFSFSPPNLITVGCVLPSANHYSKLLFATLAPIFCMAAMLLAYLILRCRLKPKPTKANHASATSNVDRNAAPVPDDGDNVASESGNLANIDQPRNESIGRCSKRRTLLSDIFAWTKDRTQLDTRFRSLFLFFLFLIYPTTSSSILGTFTCDRTFDDGSSFLAVDYSVQCFTATYNSFFIYSIFMVILYVVGIPFYFSFILFRSKVVTYFYSITNSGSASQQAGDEEQQQLIQRGEDAKGIKAGVGSSKFLWRPYKNEWYFWEVFELIRKLLQTSVLVLVSPGSPLQVVYLLVITVIMVLVIIIISPYSDNDSTNVALVCQLSILYISFACLLASVDPVGDDFDLTAIQITVAFAFGLVYAFVAYVMIRRAVEPDFSVMKTLGNLVNHALTGFFEALAKGTMDTRKLVERLWESLEHSSNITQTVLLSFQLFVVVILALPMIIVRTIWECILSLKRYYDQRAAKNGKVFRSIQTIGNCIQSIKKNFNQPTPANGEVFSSVNTQSNNTSQFSPRGVNDVNDVERATREMEQAIVDAGVQVPATPNDQDGEQLNRGMVSPASVTQPLIEPTSPQQPSNTRSFLPILTEKLKGMTGQLFGAKETVKMAAPDTPQQAYQELNQSAGPNVVDPAADSPKKLLTPPSVDVGAMRRHSTQFVTDKVKGIKLYFGLKDHGPTEETKEAGPDEEEQQEPKNPMDQNVVDPAHQSVDGLHSKMEETPHGGGDDETLENGANVAKSDDPPVTIDPSAKEVVSSQQSGKRRFASLSVMNEKLRNARNRIFVSKHHDPRKSEESKNPERDLEQTDLENTEDEDIFDDPLRDSLFDEEEEENTTAEKVSMATLQPPIILKTPEKASKTPTEVDYEEEEEEHKFEDVIDTSKSNAESQFEFNPPSSLKVSRPQTQAIEETDLVGSDYESEVEENFQEKKPVRMDPQFPPSLNADEFLSRVGEKPVNVDRVNLPTELGSKSHILPARAVVGRIKSRLTDIKESAQQAISSLHMTQRQQHSQENQRKKDSQKADDEESTGDQVEEEIYADDDDLLKKMDEYYDEDDEF